MNKLHRFDSREQLVAALGGAIVAQLTDAIAHNGGATMAVSGGNSPKPLFEFLSQQVLAWDKVTITLVDERWVDGSHEASNARLVKNTLLQNQARAAHFIDLYNGDATPFVAEKKVDQLLQEINLPFDVVVLGMGDDGHTASFFPNAQQLTQALVRNDNQRCCGIEPPAAAHLRMTLTLPTLLQCQRMFLLLTGAGKLPILEQAMAPLQNNSLLSKDGMVNPEINEYPVRSVLHQNQCDVDTYFSE